MKRENIKLAPDGKTIIINDMYIYDKEIYTLLKEIEEKDRKEILISMLRTGYTGIRRMSNGSEIDFIEKRFDAMARRFEEMFDPKMFTRVNRFKEPGTLE